MTLLPKKYMLPVTWVGERDWISPNPLHHPEHNVTSGTIQSAAALPGAEEIQL